MSGRVVHFELPADNVDRARKFYQDAFAWEITPIPDMQYTMVRAVPTDEMGRPTEPGAINGGLMQRQSPVTGPVITIDVDDIEQAQERVERLGGKVVREKFPVGEMGFAAYFTDTEDNVVGLWQTAQPR